MKIFETRQIREIDEYTIRNEPVSSDGLMERAAMGCAAWILDNIARENSFLVFTGPGNNGGDGWAIARLLADQGYGNIKLYHLQISRIISSDSEMNRQRLISQNKVRVSEISDASAFPHILKTDVVIDAIFGSGISRPLEGLPASLVQHINAAECRVVSIDIPSGLMGETNSGNPETGIIKASETLTFQFPKRSFFYAENRKYTGNWHIIPIGLHPGIIDEMQTGFYYLTQADLIKNFKKRNRFSHKGNYGHALLIAGSYGMTGAAILSARACLRSGAGLVTSHIPQSGYSIMQTAVPEVMCSIDKSPHYFTGCSVDKRYTSLGIGPGMGTAPETVAALASLLETTSQPMVLDADALNILAGHPELLARVPENTILTPHPGEFDRITGESTNGFNRNLRASELAVKNKLVIILKGAYTAVLLPDGRCFFNSTGNPGMATGGSGDVLTGIVLALLSQGYLPADAALLGTFIHGLAGDLAASENGQQAMIASDIIDNLGKAFLKFENYDPERF
jgi:hydroxyethylthiazole kinase-like uncharacterized protein yjeF